MLIMEDQGDRVPGAKDVLWEAYFSSESIPLYLSERLAGRVRFGRCGTDGAANQVLYGERARGPRRRGNPLDREPVRR